MLTPKTTDADCLEHPIRVIHNSVFVQMPEWWDGRGRAYIMDNYVFITHPYHPPHILERADGTWVPIRLEISEEGVSVSRDTNDATPA